MRNSGFFQQFEIPQTYQQEREKREPADDKCSNDNGQSLRSLHFFNDVYGKSSTASVSVRGGLQGSYGSGLIHSHTENQAVHDQNNQEWHVKVHGCDYGVKYFVQFSTFVFGEEVLFAEVCPIEGGEGCPGY